MQSEGWSFEEEAEESRARNGARPEEDAMVRKDTGYGVTPAEDVQDVQSLRVMELGRSGRDE
jgi:hypothetical protein